MGEGDEELLAKVDRSHANYQNILSRYESGTISLAAVAERLGTSVIQLWGSVAAEPERRLTAAVGSPDEASLALAAVNTKSIVVDLTAALTLEYLDLSDVVFAAFETIYVPRRVLDELEQLILNEFASDGESLAMSKEGDRYVARERTTDERRSGRETTERMLDRLRAVADIVPHTALIELKEDERKKLLSRVGEVSLATLLVAKEQRTGFLADDLVTRVTGYQKWHLPSADTQSVLLHLRSIGSIDDDTYLAALQKLAAIAYRFLRVDAADLFAILKREAFAITPAVQRPFGTLEGPDCDEKSSASIITGSLVHLYNEAVLPANIAIVVEFLCRAHAAGRDAASSMKMLKMMASSALRSRPRALAEVLAACDQIAALG